MLEFASLREWGAVLREHRVDRRFALRAAGAIGLSAATAPLRIYEAVRHGGALRLTAIHPSPVFVVGCARSGTTHLHNLLAQDPQFAHRFPLYPTAKHGAEMLPYPVRFTGETLPAPTKAPTVGEHNDAVLTHVLDYDAERIARLRESGALG